MAVSSPFGSVQEADAAYYGTDDGGGGGGGATWGELQNGASLGSGWTLAYQDQQDGSRRRWFVIRMKNDTLQALNSAGEPVEAGEETTLSELPNYSNEDDARAAFEAWGGDDESDDESDESDDWAEWKKVSTEDPWHIYSRSHTSEDRVQFLAVSTLDGSSVYLASDGAVVDDPSVFESADALGSALEAYFEAAENGNIPEGRRPSGDDPGTETVRKESSKVKTISSSEKVERLVEKMGGKKVALAAVGVGGAVAVASQTDLLNGG